MKPHFGQSDATMNKLAGCNVMPNTNKPPDLTKLDMHKLPLPDVGACSCVPCKHFEIHSDTFPCISCRGFSKFEIRDNTILVAGHTLEEHEEAAGMGLEPAFMSQGYYGHHNGCDCAVCEDIHMSELAKQQVDAAWNKLLDDYKSATMRIQELEAEVDQVTQTAINFHDAWGKYRDALHIIAHMGISGLSWQHDFEKCVNIAREALGDH